MNPLLILIKIEEYEFTFVVKYESSKQEYFLDRYFIYPE